MEITLVMEHWKHWKQSYFMTYLTLPRFHQVQQAGFKRLTGCLWPPCPSLPNVHLQLPGLPTSTRGVTPATASDKCSGSNAARRSSVTWQIPAGCEGGKPLICVGKISSWLLISVRPSCVCGTQLEVDGTLRLSPDVGTKKSLAQTAVSRASKSRGRMRNV